MVNASSRLYSRLWVEWMRGHSLDHRTRGMRSATRFTSAGWLARSAGLGRPPAPKLRGPWLRVAAGAIVTDPAPALRRGRRRPPVSPKTCRSSDDQA